MDKNLISLSKFLSLVLRHQPERIGLLLDQNGWASLEDLIHLANKQGWQLTQAAIEEVVATNEKQRFSLSEDGKRIRANQGHSIAVDLNLLAVTPPEWLFHGTVERFLPSIRLQGLQRGKRLQVHLTADVAVAGDVGARRGVPVVLSVASGAMFRAGYVFYQAENGVWLTEAVPLVFIKFPE